MTPNQLEEDLHARIRSDLKDYRAGVIGRLCPHKSVADDVIKLLVRDVHDQPIAVVHCSSPISDDLVARGARLAREAKLELGDALGRRVLEPILEGDFNELSYTITPYCRPLSTGSLRRRVENRLLRNELLDWIWNIAKATATNVGSEERDRCFHQPLKHLLQLEGISDRVRIAADRSLSRLEKGQWHPKFVLMHNDLWRGNILIALPGSNANTGNALHRRWSDRFVVIDWAGAAIRGYAFVDLAKLVDSFAVPKRRIAFELERHCETLQCEMSDVISYLLAGMGYLGLHLEHFPSDRYLHLVEKSFATLTIFEAS